MQLKNAFISTELLSAQNLDACTALSLELWPDSRYADEMAQWKQVMDSPDNFCALAKVDGQCVGFIHVAIRHGYVEGSDADQTAYLEGIYVRPGYRGQHIASMLLSRGEEWVRSKGLFQLASDAEMDNHLGRQFHEGSGFSEMNRIVCYMKNLSRGGSGSSFSYP